MIQKTDFLPSRATQEDIVEAGIEASSQRIFITICLSSGPSNLGAQAIITPRVSQLYFDQAGVEQEPKDTQT
jgi:hypothetical protein